MQRDNGHKKWCAGWNGTRSRSTGSAEHLRAQPQPSATGMASRVPLHILRAVSGVRAHLPSGSATLDKTLASVDDESLRLRQQQHEERARGVMDLLKGHKRRQKSASNSRADVVRYIDEALRLNSAARSAAAAAAAAAAALCDAPYFAELQSLQADIDGEWFDEACHAPPSVFFVTLYAGAARSFSALARSVASCTSCSAEPMSAATGR